MPVTWEEWIESEAGQECMKLLMGPQRLLPIRNRSMPSRFRTILRRAFLAGAESCEKRLPQDIRGDFPPHTRQRSEPDANQNASSAAATLGRKGGKSKSPAKLKAVRENGKLGGRPKKAAA